MDWQPHDITINGLNLHYWRAGTGKPLLMLHGVTDNGLCWGRTADALAEEYDVILLDQRGHGNSDAVPPGQYDTDRMASDAAALLKAIDAAPAIIIGHSMGGAVTMHIGADYPEVAERLIMVDPALIGLTGKFDDDARYEWYGWLRELKTMTMEQLIEKQTAETPMWSEAEIYQWAKSKLQVKPSLWEKGGMDLRRDWRDILPKLQVPALIAHGDPEYGALVSDETAQEAREILPIGEVIMVEKTGHSVYRDDFEQFIGVVRNFLAKPY